MNVIHELKNLLINSVDFCAQGANPDADIKLLKSIEEKGGEGMSDDLFTRLCQKLKKSQDPVQEELTPSEETALINKAMTECIASIEADRELDDVEKMNMLKENLVDFTKYYEDTAKKWDQTTIKKTEDKEKMSDVFKGFDIEGMEASDAAILKALSEKYEKACKKKKAEPSVDDEDEDKDKDKDKELPFEDEDEKKEKGKMAKSIEDELKKAMEEAKQEIAELKKSTEMAELNSIAKEYVCIGKKVDELAPKLYEMKKASGSVYDDYIALLEETKNARMSSDVFKTFGNDGAYTIGKTCDLNAAVSEIKKAKPELTHAQAVVEAYERNPDLPEI